MKQVITNIKWHYKFYLKICFMIYSLTFYAYYNLDADCACNKKKEIVWKELLKQEKVGVLLGKFLPTLLVLSSYIEILLFS